MANIITVTLNPCVDKFFTIDRLIAEQKLRALDVEKYPGGGGLNVSRAIAHLGGKSIALWSCGGATGQHLLELLANDELDQHIVPISGETRENVIVYEKAGDQYYRFSLPGPRLSESEQSEWVKSLSNVVSSGDYVVVSGSLPPGVPATWLSELIVSMSGDHRVVLDTKGDALKAALETGVFLAKPNIVELSRLVERELIGDEDVEAAGRQIIENDGAEALMISMGRAGALLIDRTSAEHIRAPIVPIHSKVGAGDSMVAGMVMALSRGMSMRDAALFGVAAGTAAVMTDGTQLCTREDTERLYARMSEPAKATVRLR